MQTLSGQQPEGLQEKAPVSEDTLTNWNSPIDGLSIHSSFNTFQDRPQEMDEHAKPSYIDEKDLGVIKNYGESLKEYTFKYINRLMNDKNADEKDVNGEFIMLREFWGISKASCLARFPRVAEIAVKKYNQGTKNDCCLVRGFKAVINRSQQRWLLIGYNNIWYYNDSSAHPDQMSDNMMLDQSCKLSILKLTTRHITIKIEMSRRSLKIKLDYYQGLYAYNSLVKAFRYSSYSCLHRFKSFAPERDQNDCRLFSDGKGYFRELADRLRHAKEEIMICGWMISPEMSMVRPVRKDHANGEDICKDPSNLISLLRERAFYGVRVYVLVYQEFRMQMYNDSLHCKTVLEALNHKNIKVLRHPTAIGQALLWSHHEKMVIIDRSCVMMGGLDIAWGRWDTNSHDLFDFYGGRNFPGVDYYNAFTKDFLSGKEYQKSLIAKDKPRMPWHDVAMRLEGPIVFDFLTHFVTYWNNSRELNNEKEVLFTQLSVTNPRFYISNNIKKILRGKVGDVSVLELWLRKNYPENKGKQGSIKVENQVVEDIMEPKFQKNETNMNEQGEDDDKKDSLEYSKHHDGFTDMNLVKYADNIEGENKYANEYEDNFLKNFDQGFEDQAFLHRLEEAPIVINSASRLISPSQNVAAPITGTSKAFVPGKDNTGEVIVANNVESLTMHGMHARSPSAPTAPKIDKASLKLAEKPEEYLRVHADLEPTDQVELEEVWSPHFPETMLKDRRDYNDDDPVLEDIYQIPIEGLVRQTFKEEHFKNTTFYTPSKFGAKGKLKMQALRSASPWSIGLTLEEKSIQNCYIEIITKSKNYIYIENQFFISSTSPEADTDEVIRNRIAKAIFERVKKAIQLNQNFKVIIFIPLLPAFEANLDEQEGSLMQVQIALENRTLGSQERGLIRSISNITDHPEKYIMICALRKYQYPPKLKEIILASKKPENIPNNLSKTGGNHLKVPNLEPHLSKDEAGKEKSQALLNKKDQFNSYLKKTTQDLKLETLQDLHDDHGHEDDENPTHEEDKTKDPMTELIYIHSKVDRSNTAYHSR